ncbi:hypothetical protein B0H16DRAFT_1712942 [Mycena metata]|uniref:Uncharacterized protein n=1 Tax=Mycena metata TaxID=1033252 RepID=A0AAD7NU81_9AGAR|nr:hypothetical protein B0H16DRAFT_1712942 [Mycena metata]
MPSNSKLTGFITVALAMRGVVHAQDPLPIPLSFVAYANDDGSGAQTTQEAAVTGVCYNTGIKARSYQATPAKGNSGFESRKGGR